MNKKQNQYKGKNILITGASRGIGKSLTMELSSLGMNVIMLSKNETALDLIYDEIKKKIWNRAHDLKMRSRRSR